jgi:hypothetical protein
VSWWLGLDTIGGKRKGEVAWPVARIGRCCRVGCDGELHEMEVGRLWTTTRGDKTKGLAGAAWFPHAPAWSPVGRRRASWWFSLDTIGGKRKGEAAWPVARTGRCCRVGCDGELHEMEVELESRFFSKFEI